MHPETCAYGLSAVIIQFYIGLPISNSLYVINLLKIQAESFSVKIWGRNVFVLLSCFMELYIHLLYIFLLLFTTWW